MNDFEKMKKAAEQIWRTKYRNKWRGSTMHAIVVSAYCAGYEKAKKGTESD